MTKPVFQKKPCKQCPFRKKAMKGWLGEAHPESFVGTLLLESEVLPCHSTIDYSRKDWHEAWTMRREGKACAGAIATACNSGKRPRYLTVPVPERNREEVFARFADFIEHHRNSPIQSWTEPTPGTIDAAGRDAVREMVGLVPLGKKGA